MIIGIDIGTSYSSACIIDKTGKAVPVDIATGLGYGDKYSLPSAVFLQENQEGEDVLLIGQMAMLHRRRNPSHFKMEFKRLLGEKVPIMLGRRQYRPEEFYVEFFRHIKKCVQKIILGDVIEKVYITYPASYENDKREKIEWAAHIAGFGDIILLDEPTAAAIGSIEIFSDNMKILIYDFGGGTFDVSLLEYKDKHFRQITESTGLKNCGGNDIDRMIFSDIISHIDKEILKEVRGTSERQGRFDSQIAETAVRIKHQLSSVNTAVEYIAAGYNDIEYTLTVDKLNQMIAQMVGQTISLCYSLLTTAGLSPKDLSMVLMSGGTSRIPLVQSMVKQFAGDIPVCCSQDLELAVARGAAIYGAGSQNIDVSPIVNIMEAALNGDKEAQWKLGNCYEKGEGVKKSIKEAVKWYEKAALQSYAKAQWRLGECYKKGEGTKENLSEAAKWYKAAAEQGYAPAQYSFGMYMESMENRQEAVKWYKKAAEQGYAAAQNQFGVCCENGTGCPADRNEAVKWYKKAAEQGNMDAEYHLANCMLTETWMVDMEETKAEQYEITAAEHYKKAAEKGHIDALYCMGLSFFYGKGIQKDREQALKYYKTAAEKGNIAAQFKLAECYYYGIGTEENKQEAAKWYREAAEQGDAQAQYQFGLCCEYGEGIQKDKKEALKWYINAAKQNDKRALRYLEMIYPEKIHTEVNKTDYLYYNNNEIQYHISKMSASMKNTVLLKKDGTVIAAGSNQWGQCNIKDWKNIISVDCSDYMTVGLKQNGTVVAMGNNEEGQCNVQSWKEIVSIACGRYHTVGLSTYGTVKVVGRNKNGQCDVQGWKEIVSIASSSVHVVGLRKDGTVVARGENGYGQCDVRDWRNISAIFCCGCYTVGLQKDGTVVTTKGNHGPYHVQNWKNIISINVKNFHIVGLREDGTVVADGTNQDGRCNVKDWKNIISIACGVDHTVGLKKDGTVVATGRNGYGQCDVENWKNIIAIGCGYHHTIGIKTDGTIVATGRNDYGQCDIKY